MNDRERLIELIVQSTQKCDSTDCNRCKYWNTNDCGAARMADILLKNGVIVPPCNVGDTVYLILEDKMVEGGLYVTPAHTITEVGSKGFWLSGCVPAEDDMSDFNLWEELGKTIFLTRKEAEKALLKRSVNNG